MVTSRTTMDARRGGSFAAPFYVVGGTLHPKSPSYVERAADRLLFEHCHRGDFCQVLSSRQTGKSSLMARTVGRLRREGFATAAVDLSAGQTGDPERWYRGLARVVVRELGLELDLAAWWQARSQLPAARRLEELFGDVVLADPGATTVIFFDEVDATLELPFTDDFFASIRACHNLRATHERFQRLSFVLLGVASAAELIKNARRTPYNVGYLIELRDFSATEAHVLLGGLDLPRDRGDAVLDHVLEWTGGQPYLTQKLLAEVARRRLPSEGLGKWLSHVVDETFLTLEKRQQESNLTEIPRRLRKDPPDLRRAQLELYRRVLQGKRQRYQSALPFVRLKLIGLVTVGADGFLHVRNEIYRRTFDAHWIKAEMPPRVRRSQRGWAAAFVVSLAVLIWLGYDIVRLAQASDLPPEASYRRLSWFAPAKRLYAGFWDRQAQRAERKGDFAETMLFSLRALQVDEADERREMIGNLEQLLEPLERVWHADKEERILALGDRGDWYVSARRQGGAELRFRDRSRPPEVLAGVEVARVVGEVLLTGDTGGRLAVYRTTGRSVSLLGVSEPSPTAIRHLAASRDLEVLVSAGAGVARVWRLVPESDAGKVSVLQVAKVDVEPRIASLAVASGRDAAIVASVAPDSTEVTLRWLGSGQAWRKPLYHGAEVTLLAFGGSGRLFGAAGPALLQWSFASDGDPLRTLKQGTSNITSLVVSGERLAVARHDGTVTIWELHEVTETSRFQLRDRAIEMTTLGSERLTTVTNEGEIAIWSLRAPGPPAQKLAEGFEVRILELGPRARWLAVGREDGRLDLWSLDRSPNSWPLAVGAPVTSLAFDTEERWLAAGDAKGEARIWRVDSVPHPAGRYQHGAPVEVVALRPGGRQLFVGTADGVITVWLDEGRRQELEPHEQSIADLAFDLGGRWLLSEDQASVVRLWDLESLDQGSARSFPLPSEGGDMTVHDFDPGGRWLVTGRATGRLEIWDLSGESPASRPRALELGAMVTAVGWGPKSDRLVVATRDGEVRHLLWDGAFLSSRTDDGLARSDWPGSDEPGTDAASDHVRALAFRADGRALVLFRERRIFIFTASADPESPWLRRSLSYGGWSGNFHFGTETIVVISPVGRREVSLESIRLQERAVDPTGLMEHWQPRLGRRLSQEQPFTLPIHVEE